MEYLNLLNIKPSFNFLSSTIKPSDYINFLVKNSFSTGFYAENDTMYGVAEFVELCNKNNIKPVIGVNIKVSFGEIILYAKNNSGYKIVSELSSFISNLDNRNIEAIEKTLFKLLSNDLIIVVIFSVENIDSFKDKILSKVDESNFYFGINSSNYIYFEKQTNVVFAQEINFLNENDFFVYKSLKAIKQGCLLQELESLDKTYYLDKQSISNFINLDKHLKNIDLIVKQIEVDIIKDHKKHFLKYPNANNMPSNNYLKFICQNYLEEYMAQKNIVDKEKYFQRLEYELDVINKMGFEDYFLIVYDMIKFANENKILVGPGRGSAAGSLVSFLLKITSLDPIEWDLLFERFLNIERQTMPDIDIDFQDDRREEVLEYLFNKYGKDHFATITTFQTIGIKNALRDCGRIFNIDIDEINQMAKSINEKNIKDLDQALQDSEVLRKYKEKYPQMFEVAQKIIGLPRQTGTHAAGVVFCDVNLYEVVPTKMGINGISQTQFSMNYLEDIGLIKTDILGLRNLSIIKEVINSIKLAKHVEIDLNSIPLDDKKTFQDLANGDTTGIFQLESPGMTEVIKKMQVKSIDEIALTSALYRPGPQENIPLFIERKNKGNKDYVIDPNLEQILEPTYGIIVYQEQVMKILQKAANMNLSKADIVRRAMGKKDIKLMNQFKNEFIQGCLKNNYTENKAIELWHYIEKFAAYGFNKSHAIAYSIIGYWLAYLKTHYKAEFYCSLLNGVIRNESKTSQYLTEIKNAGFIVNPPNIKNPNNFYFAMDKTIFMPLNVIKNIGPEFIKNLKNLFKKDKTIFNDFLTLISYSDHLGLTHQRYVSLVYAGAFDIFGYSRKQLIKYENEIFNLADIVKKTKNKDLTLDLDQVKDEPTEIINYEKEYLGFFVSSHPLSLIRKKIINNDKLVTINHLSGEGIIYNVLLSIDYLNTRKDKNGNMMCFIEATDETGQINLTVFSSVYESIKTKINVNKFAILKIKTQIYNSKITAVLLEFIKEI